LIDMTTEELISLPDAAARLPLRRGRPVNLATLYRWTTCGVKGVVLESIQIGGTRCTSVEAMQHFFDQLSGVKSRRGRRSRVSQVSRELDALGV
jgi:hypothetical protein